MLWVKGGKHCPFPNPVSSYIISSVTSMAFQLVLYMCSSRPVFHQINANIFLVDWGKGASMMNYLQVASNTRIVGAEVARWVCYIIQLINNVILLRNSVFYLYFGFLVLYWCISYRSWDSCENIFLFDEIHFFNILLSDFYV